MSKVSHTLRALAGLWLLVSLSGCGWHLRGSQAVDLTLPPVYIQVQQVSTALLREVASTLKGANVAVVPVKTEAQMVVTLERERSDRRVLSVDGSGNVQAYELQYGLTFSVRGATGKLLLPSETLTFQRDYSFDETEVLAKTKEQQQLFDMMRRNAVQQLMRRLQGLAEGGAVSDAD